VREARLLAGRLRLLAQHGLGSDSGSACAGVAVADEGDACDARQLVEAARGALEQAVTDGPDGQALARAKTPTNAETPLRTTAADRLAMLRTLARMVDEQHHGGVAHSAAVARRARDVAVELGLRPQEVERVALAGEFHDIGRALIPMRLFADDGVEARTVRQRHAVLGARLVRAAGFPAVAALIAGLHRPPDEAADAAPADRAGRALAIAERLEEAMEREEAGAAGAAAALADLVAEGLEPDVHVSAALAAVARRTSPAAAGPETTAHPVTPELGQK
jgi:putative nucleotidyltransferase with HDIG domain